MNTPEEIALTGGAYNQHINVVDLVDPDEFISNRWFAFLNSGFPGGDPVPYQKAVNTPGLQGSIQEADANARKMRFHAFVFGGFIGGAILFFLGRKRG